MMKSPIGFFVWFHNDLFGDIKFIQIIKTKSSEDP